MNYLPFLSVETWTLLITFICLFIAYGYWPSRALKKLGVPGPKPVPFLGSILEYGKIGFFQMDMHFFRTYGRLWGFLEGRQLVLVTMDPRMIKTVLVKECFSYFINRRDFRFNGPLNDAVSNARDDDWRCKRGILSPMFASGRLKEMFTLMTRQSDILVQSLQGMVHRDEVVDIRECFGSFSLDSMAHIAFSIETGSLNNPNDPIVKKMKGIFNLNFTSPLFLVSALFPFTNPLLEKANLCIFPLDDLKFLYTMLNKVVDDREKDMHKNHVDFLQFMLKSQLPEAKRHTKENKQNKGLTRHEIVSQVAISLFAGYETTSKSLSFLAYSLATNPDVMKKLQDQIDEAFPNKAPVTYEQLVQMEYLDMVLNESQRLYPIVIRLERLCTETIDISGVTVPNGTVVMIPVYALHHDPELWPEPECFNPERFSKDNRDSIDPYAFLPFGAGPRNCIGQRFVTVLMKLAVVRVLQNFSFATCAETEIPLQMDQSILLGTKNPIKLKLVPRDSIMKEE